MNPESMNSSLNTKKIKYLTIQYNLFVILTVFGAISIFIQQLPYEITKLGLHQ